MNHVLLEKNVLTFTQECLSGIQKLQGHIQFGKNLIMYTTLIYIWVEQL